MFGGVHGSVIHTVLCWVCTWFCGVHGSVVYMVLFEVLWLEMLLHLSSPTLLRVRVTLIAAMAFKLQTFTVNFPNMTPLSTVSTSILCSLFRNVSSQYLYIEVFDRQNPATLWFNISCS